MELTEEKLDEIVREIEEGNCIPFLGSAASISNNGFIGPPIGSHLAEELAIECNYPGNDKKNLPKVAQFFEYKRTRKKLIDYLVNRILPFTEPSPLHKLISQISFKFKTIITTNYDRLMEIALDRRGITWLSFIHNPLEKNPLSFFPPRGFKGPVIYKMHGTIQDPKTIIVTENDYIEFLTKLKPNDLGVPSNIPVYFMKDFTMGTFLFLGYELEDLNFKVLFKGIMENLDRHIKLTSYAIQKKPSDISEEYWNLSKKYWATKKIEIYDIDIYEFANKLADKFGVTI